MQENKELPSLESEREAERQVVEKWLDLADSLLQRSRLTVRRSSRQFDIAKSRLVAAWRKPSTLGPWLEISIGREI